MNKYQEALDDLSYPDSSSPCYGCKCGESDCGDCNIKKDILALKELVDKETPKKPLPNKKIKKGTYINWECPNCKEYVSSGFYYPPLEKMANNHKRCKNCGQKLDWEVEK